VYCQDREADRKWKFQSENYSKSFLKKSVIKYKNRFIHINFDIWKKLNKLNPKIIITTGFNPTFLIAFLWCILKRRKHVCMSDGWEYFERNLSIIHIIIRKIVYKFSKAFIGPSDKSFELYKSYKCDKNKMFKSYLCTDNNYYSQFIQPQRNYDVIFSGQFIDIKLPFFFCDVLKKVKENKNNLKVLLLGDGPLKEQFIDKLKEYNIDYSYPGFVDQKELPKYYADSKILLFPTTGDCWGVVTNEACAVGTPVITTPFTAAADELVINDVNGYVLPVDVDIWAKHVNKLLDDKALLKKFSEKSLEMVQKYNFDDAAQGIIDAIQFVDNN